MPVEKRVDAEDGQAYSFDELAAFYKGTYKKAAIEAYWESCKAVKAKGKGKGAAKAPEPKAKAKVKAKAKANREQKPRDLTIGYHQIRGLGAPLRMMCYYRSQPFTNVAIGADLEAWFGKIKPELLEKHSGMNLPYIVDAGAGKDGTVVTQSNTCLVYLGRVLRIDKGKDFFHNHFVLDQVMDWRNDLIKVVYPPPFGLVTTQDEFKAAAKKHLEEGGSAKTNMTKLEGACRGVYMCGAAPQSGDFHVFEMLDQHKDIAATLGMPDPMQGFEKLKALHAAFKADPKLAKYWESDSYKDYAQNSPIFAQFTGKGTDFKYGPTVTEKITF